VVQRSHDEHSEHPNAGSQKSPPPRGGPAERECVVQVIDRALEEAKPVDWDAHYKWLHKHGRVVKGHPDDEMRRRER
jgi:hypothetical protein